MEGCKLVQIQSYENMDRTAGTTAVCAPCHYCKDRMGPESSTGDPAGLIWLDTLLPTVVGLSTFGGSITFTIIPAQNAIPTNRFDEGTVRTFVSLAWLFFILAFGCASTAQMVLALHRETIKAGFMDQRRKTGGWDWVVIGLFCWFPMSLFLQLLILTAFLFLSLVVVAFVPVVGWIAVCMTSLFFAGSVIVWALWVTTH